MNAGRLWLMFILKKSSLAFLLKLYLWEKEDFPAFSTREEAILTGCLALKANRNNYFY